MLASHDYGGINLRCAVITDLPLAATKPMDTGLMCFCKTCMKCADNAMTMWYISKDKKGLK